MQPSYLCAMSSPFALTAGSAKTGLGVKAHANSGLDLLRYGFGFDQNAVGVPVLVELMYSTWGANSPGTNSTSITPLQGGGRVITPGFTAGRAWTSEPTTLTLLRPHYVIPHGGQLMYEFSLGREIDAAVSEGFVLRFTLASGAPATNMLGYMDVARI